MSKYATLLVESKDNEQESKERIEKLKKETKEIVSIRTIERDPAVEKMLADIVISDPSGKRANIIIEVKLGKGTDLNKIREQIQRYARSVVTVEPI